MQEKKEQLEEEINQFAAENNGLILALPMIALWELDGTANGIRAKIVEQGEDIDAEKADLVALGVDGYITTGGCPVQFEGTVDGHFLYFRARGCGWTFDIAHTEEQIWKNPVYSEEQKYGTEFDASWMPHKVALGLIAVEVQKWKASKAESQ